MPKSQWVKIRIAEDEKEAFQDAANLAGISLSGWMRERLRRAARIELADAGLKVAFIQQKTEVT